MSSRTILVIDDNFWIRRLVVTVLRRHGFACDEAIDGLEAMERIRERDYDGIILDLMMPRANGFEVIGFLTAERPALLATTIVLTADSSRWNDPALSPVAKVVQKPFDVTDFVGQVEEILGGSAGAETSS
jgi:DNA-binding response OmpR family regulator